jgi:hypothetical protein
MYDKKPDALVFDHDIDFPQVNEVEFLHEEKLRTDILNAFKDVVAFYSPNHTMLWLNEAGKQQLGISDESYVGRLCYKVWFNADKPCLTCPVVSRKLETTERLVSLTDDKIWMVRHTPLFRSDGVLKGFIEFRADITQFSNLEKRQKQVAADALYLNQKNSILYEIESVLNKTLDEKKFSKSRKDFKKIFDIINSFKQLDKDWKMLIANFEEVHPGFFSRLKKTHPLLSSNDIKHCACIKMNFGTKEIARFFNIKDSSVQISRVRLKKKMNLPADVNLLSYILNF